MVPLTPTPLDFTVNRASPLVTERQCAPFPPFQPRRVQVARQFSECDSVILAPFSPPLFLLTEHPNRAWKRASLLGQRARPDLVIFYNTDSPSTLLCSRRNECIVGRCKVNGPHQTKEIRFGNFAVTGVLWLCPWTTRKVAAAWPVALLAISWWVSVMQ